MSEEHGPAPPRPPRIIQLEHRRSPAPAARYCTETCPKNIPIPDYLSLLQEGHSTTQVVYYFNLAQNHGRAGDCIECRQCEHHCPQHIEITKHLKEVSKAYDGFKGW